jgi:hypothetical protein
MNVPRGMRPAVSNQWNEELSDEENCYPDYDSFNAYGGPLPEQLCSESFIRDHNARTKGLTHTKPDQSGQTTERLGLGSAGEGDRRFN